jgi:hypothetical protein
MATTDTSAGTADSVKTVAVVAPPAPAKIATLPATPAATEKVAAKVTAKPVAKKSASIAKTPGKTSVKTPVKATVKAAVKSPVKASSKIAKKAPVKAPIKVAAKPLVKPVAKPKIDKQVKLKKPKLVRDSFTIPKAEYTVLDDLKQRATKLASAVKKSELIRAGVKALAAMSDAAFQAALKAVPAIKTGRPSKTKAD